MAQGVDELMTKACMDVAGLWFWQRWFRTPAYRKTAIELSIAIQISSAYAEQTHLPESYRKQLNDRINFARSLRKERFDV